MSWQNSRTRRLVICTSYHIYSPSEKQEAGSINPWSRPSITIGRTRKFLLRLTPMSTTTPSRDRFVPQTLAKCCALYSSFLETRDVYPSVSARSFASNWPHY